MLAGILNISPIALLTPEIEDPDAEVLMSGTHSARAETMYLWLRGERSLADDKLDDFEREAFRRTSNPVWTYKEVR